MDSGINDLKSSDRLMCDGAIKVYTRKGKRKAALFTANYDGATKSATTTTTAAPQTVKSDDYNQKKEIVDVHEPSRQTLESEETKHSEQQEDHPKARPQVQDISEQHNSLRRNSTGDGASGDEHVGVGEVQVNFIDEQDGVIRCHPAVQDNHIGGSPSLHCVETQVIKPLISRVEDRVRIDFSGERSVDEIRDLMKKVESELIEVRCLVNKLETAELQLAAHDNKVEISSFGHQDFRRFRPPSISVTENNLRVGELVEKEKRTPKANQYYTNEEFLLGKDWLPPESNKKLQPNGAKKKRGGQPEHGLSFSFGSYKHKNNVFRNCSTLLQKLMRHTYGWVFNNPVDAGALGLQDYHDIIKHPMDFGTIKTRLSQNWYKSPTEFAHDVRLVFRNAMTYNPKGQDVHIMAEQMSKIFEEKWVVIEADFNPSWKLQVYHDSGLPTPTTRKAPPPVPASVLTPKIMTCDRSESIAKPAPKIMTSVPKKPKAKDSNKRDMTFEEKQKLGTNLQTIPPERLDDIVKIIRKRNSAPAQHSDEIELDIDHVDAETLWELDRLVTDCKKSLSKNRNKAEFKQARSALATIPCSVVDGSQKERRSGETNGCPNTGPAAAQGDTQVDNANRSSSSSSSSSDSGSSSSDSDSDSSSTSGSDELHSPKS